MFCRKEKFPFLAVLDILCFVVFGLIFFPVFLCSFVVFGLIFLFLFGISGFFLFLKKK